jgi:Kef-type K+ transport system membrane component KefB
MYLQHIKMQLLEFGLLLVAAYVGGKITQKLNMGEIVGQILGGMLVSPYSLELMYTLFLRYRGTQAGTDVMQTYHFRMTQFPEYARILEGYLFFVFLLLGIIAFSIGEELHRDRLRHIHWDSVLISLFQALFTFLLLALGFWGMFGFSCFHAMLIGSIGVASAPVLTRALDS